MPFYDPPKAVDKYIVPRNTPSNTSNWSRELSVFRVSWPRGVVCEITEMGGGWFISTEVNG